MKNANLIIIFAFWGICFAPLTAQNVGIGTATPDASAKLHIEDVNRGLLINRVSLTDVSNSTTPVNAPITGLLVFNTNAGVTGGNGQGFYYWDGTIWQRLQAANEEAWLLNGNTGTVPGTDFLGTTDAQDLVFKTNNVENMRINTSGNIDIGAAFDDARVYARILNTDLTTNHGMYVYHDGGITAGSTYGIRSHNYSSTNSTKYGFYNVTNADGTGGRFGIYNFTYLNTASNSVGYGLYNYLSTHGSSSQYGFYNYVTSADATGSHYGIRNYLYLNPNSTAINYGQYHFVDYSAGTRYGSYNILSTSTLATGTVYGDYTYVTGSGNDLIYGFYANVTNSGSGTHYGFYSDVPGGTNDFAALFNAGHVVANESGGDYDFRVETDTRSHALWVDANENITRFGTASAASDWGDGGTVAGVTVDYVVDFDNGTASGTAIGIGSVEYFVDLLSETAINNDFGPTANIVYDMGWTYAWNDIYADNFFNVSDARLKTQIEDMTYGLKEVMELKPVSYKWKETHKGKTLIPEEERELNIGFLAQDVITTMPELVKVDSWKPKSEEEPDVYVKKQREYMAVNYVGMVPVLVKAMQEQQAQIEALKAEIEILKQK